MHPHVRSIIYNGENIEVVSIKGSRHSYIYTGELIFSAYSKELLQISQISKEVREHISEGILLKTVIKASLLDQL